MEAERGNLSVTRLRRVAQRQEKAIDKANLSPERKSARTISLRMSGANTKMFKKLAAARNLFYESLLYSIVAAYFRANKESITKELEEFDAQIKKSRQETKELRKAKQLRDEDAMKDPRRIELMEYRKWLFREVGINASNKVDNYLRRECGTPILSDVPMPVIEELLARLGGQKEQAAALKAVENLQWRSDTWKLLLSKSLVP